MKLSILAKLNAILVALSIPIVILLYLFVQETNVNINFGQKEIYGDDYLKTTRKIFDNVTQLSSSIVRNRKYNLDSKENISTIQDKITADLKELEAVQKKYTGTFEFKNSSDKVNSFVNKWKLVHDQAFKGSVEDETDRYNSIIAELRNLIVYVGNESNLILDPDLDTYYLMDFTLLKHPSISDLVYRLET